LERQEQFRQAMLYGRLIITDPDKKAGYEKAVKVKRKPLSSLTIAEFFHAPVVDEVDLSN